jgi:hypothetical protein
MIVYCSAILPRRDETGQGMMDQDMRIRLRFYCY